MEELNSFGVEGDVTRAAREEADKLLTDAASLFGSTTQEVRATAKAKLIEAEDEIERVLGEVYDKANGLTAEVDQSVRKFVQKIRTQAGNAYDDARMTMFGEGGWPQNNYRLLKQELAEGDFDELVMTQIIEPLVARAAGEETEFVPGDPRRGGPAEPDPDQTPPDGITLPDGWDTVTPPSPSPTPIPSDGRYCPPQPPSCPPPQVVVVPVQPCPQPQPIPVPGPAPGTGVEPEPEEDTPPVSDGEEEDEEEEEGEAPVPPVPVPPAPPRPNPAPENPPYQLGRPPRPVGIGAPAGRADWSAPDRCATLKSEVAAPQRADLPKPGELVGGLGTIISSIDSALGGLLGTQSDNPVYQAVWAGLSQLADFGTQAGYSLITGISGIASSQVVGAYSALAAASWSEWLTGGPAMYLAQGYMYDLQYSAPQFLPTQAEVDALRLSNEINQELWECLTKANGNHLWARELVLRAKRNRAPVSDLISLWRRGSLTDVALTDYASQVGVMNNTDLEIMKLASEFIPPYSDIIRMMVRDANDKTTVDAFELDTGFTDKYGGQLREWARAQGISDDVFRFLWRSHWQLPSPTQLYQMLHRLRPGKPGVEAPVDADLVKKTLLANDLSPTFVDRLMSVSYNTLTRTDLLQFFTNGSIGKLEVVSRLQDTGYTREDAKAIADAWEVEVANRRQNRARLFTRNNTVRAYIAGEVSIDRAKAILSRSIPEESQVLEILEDADEMRRVVRRRKCIKAIRRKRITGEIDEMQSRRELVAQGVEPLHASEIAEGWTCEIVSMSKEPTVSQMTKWFLEGIIGPDEFTRRLINLRYSREDAKRIMDTVVLQENKRRAKQMQAAQEKAARAAERAAREAERRREKARKELERLQKEQEKKQKEEGQSG